MLSLDQIIIDDEFRDFLPALDAESLDRLRTKIELEGWTDEPITVWQHHNILLDGHNRLGIWSERGDDGPPVREKAFASREAALHWIAFNQCARRNLSPEQERYVLGKQYKAEKNLHGGTGANQHTPKEQSAQPDLSAPLKSSNPTAERIGREHGVSQATVRRAEVYADAVDDLEKHGVIPRADILAGKVKVSPAKVIEAAKVAAVETPEAAKAVLAKTRTAAKAGAGPTTEYRLDSDRAKQVARKNYERLGILFGQTQAIADGIESINLDAAMSVLRRSDAESWIEDAKRTVSALKAISQRLKTEVERAGSTEAPGEAEDGVGDGGQVAG